MDYQKQLVNVEKDANDIQAKLVNMIEQNSKTTKRHNWIMVVLTVIIAVSAFINIVLPFFRQPLVLPFFRQPLDDNTTGRYAIAIDSRIGGVYVLDTKTTDLWLHAEGDKEYPPGGYYRGRIKSLSDE